MPAPPGLAPAPAPAPCAPSSRPDRAPPPTLGLRGGGDGEGGGQRRRETTQAGVSSGGHLYLRGVRRSGALSAPLPPGLSFPFPVPKPPQLRR